MVPRDAACGGAPEPGVMCLNKVQKIITKEKTMKIAAVILILLSVLSQNSFGEDTYYEIINQRMTFDYHPDYPWVKNSNKEYQKLLYKIPVVDQKEYKAANGDVGKLIVDLQPFAHNIVIDVSGFSVMIKRDAVKKVSKNEYDSFNEKVGSLSNNYFGFSLGDDTFEQVTKKLEEYDSSFDNGYSYKGYRELPVIKIEKYSNFPVLHNSPPDSAWLNFIDDKVYSVELTWMHKPRLRRLVFDGLTEKFDRDFKVKVRDERSDSKWYWWNGSTAVEIKDVYKSFSSDASGFTLTYYHRDLRKKAEELRKEIRIRIAEKEQADRKAEISNFANQL